MNRFTTIACVICLIGGTFMGWWFVPGIRIVVQDVGVCEVPE